MTLITYISKSSENFKLSFYSWSSWSVMFLCVYCINTLELIYQGGRRSSKLKVRLQLPPMIPSLVEYSSLPLLQFISSNENNSLNWELGTGALWLITDISKSSENFKLSFSSWSSNVFVCINTSLYTEAHLSKRKQKQ